MYRTFDCDCADTYDEWNKYALFIAMFIIKCGKNITWSEFKCFWLHCQEQSLIRKCNKLYHQNILKSTHYDNY